MTRKVLFFYVVCILAMGIFYGYINTLDLWLQEILYFLIPPAIAISSYYFTYRKKRLTLTEDELQSPLIEYQDLSNRNTWLNYVFVLVIFCLLPSFSFVSSVTEMWLEGKSWEAIWAFQVEVWDDIIATSVSWWLIVPIMIAIWLRAMMQNAKNMYVIDGDTLIIQENFILKTEEEIRIPIDCIEDVYTSSKWALNPYLWIKVNGVTRRCHSYPHSLELGKAILRHKHALSSNN